MFVHFLTPHIAYLILSPCTLIISVIYHYIFQILQKVLVISDVFCYNVLKVAKTTDLGGLHMPEKKTVTIDSDITIPEGEEKIFEL